MFSHTYKKTAPIGIFDSGLGGLTVAKAITQLLTGESIVYFGDTAHTPWGNKSATTITSYATKICNFLIEQECKLIVVACNTAASVCLNKVKEIASLHNIEVIDVIDPVIKYIDATIENKEIALIGTKQTIKANTYQERISSLDKNINLHALATPLLVPLIEEGWINNEPMHKVLQIYLNQLPKNIHGLILGCTHYPIVEGIITKKLGTTKVINSAKLTAIAVQQYLNTNNLNNTTKNKSENHFYVSDEVEMFEPLAKQLFFSGMFNLEYVPIFK